MHNYLLQDFTLLNNDQYRFSSLQNMGMAVTGLTGFKIPREDYYNFGITLSNLGGQSYYDLITNYNYFDLFFSYAAFQMKFNFVCQDCTNSTIIYDNRFCVEQCPRLFSISTDANGLKYCDKCDVQKLKVVDVDTGNCVCAKRHFLDSNVDSCKPCSYDCMTCTTVNRCLTCDNSLLQTKRRLNSASRC